MAIDGRGGIATVAEDELLTRAIRLILLTVPGERHMRPEFGCRQQSDLRGGESRDLGVQEGLDLERQKMADDIRRKRLDLRRRQILEIGGLHRVDLGRGQRSGL